MKKAAFPILLSLVFFFLFSCGTVQEQADSNKRPRPQWTNTIAEHIDEDDRVLFIGASSNTATEEQSLNSAAQNAFEKASKYFGVSVSSTSIDIREKTNGKSSYQFAKRNMISGKNIEIKEYDFADSYTEKSGGRYSSFILLAISKEELNRIRIEVDGFGVWAMKSDLQESSEKIRELFPALSSKGVKLNQEIDYFSRKESSEIFKETGKAYFLKIECSETRSEEYSGEFYSIIKITAELFNLMTGESMKRWNAEGKGAAYSREDAVSDGITKAVREIQEEIESN